MERRGSDFLPRPEGRGFQVVTVVVEGYVLWLAGDSYLNNPPVLYG
ncbi:MAG: hypothetical protein QXK88_11680 [Desulfurococcaceae archaeon]